MSNLTPREIVSELDKYIIGQEAAKRMVAIAMRNRWRRQQIDPELRDEIAPKNIILMGPTGVGKTEIARRLARLTNCPFFKVEATKFTEVGYVGRGRGIHDPRPHGNRREHGPQGRNRKGSASRRRRTPKNGCWTCSCPARNPSQSGPMGYFFRRTER